jgi:SAM-dependent methyltransferase
VTNRPFYTTFAWAYDWIMAEPSQEHYDHIIRLFASRGIGPGSRLLDAGCGTGRYALAMARAGYQVMGVDASPDLLLQARQKAAHEQLRLTFEEGDLLRLAPETPYDGILCRGVLNDLLDDVHRQAVFFAFASALRPAGVLVLDVREWHSTELRYTREPLFTRQMETERGTLTFQSLTSLEHETRTLRIAERHELQRGPERITADNAFAMRCWLREEVQTYLVRAGFGAIEYLGAYDPRVAVGASDRIVAIAQRLTLPTGTSAEQRP